MEELVPFRVVILKALTSALESIGPEVGYHTRMKDRVFRGRIRFGDDDPIPMIGIIEPPVPPESLPVPEPSHNPIQQNVWELLVQGFVEDDMDHPSDAAHVLMAHVKAALVRSRGSERERNILGLGERIISLTMGQGTVRPPEEVNIKGFFWLRVDIEVAENIADPWE